MFLTFLAEEQWALKLSGRSLYPLSITLRATELEAILRETFVKGKPLNRPLW